MTMSQLFSKLTIILILSALLYGAGELLAKKSFLSQAFLSPFECGFSPYSTAFRKFSSRFFLIALVFLIFDVELILLFPYLVVNFTANLFKLLIMLLIVNFLSFGLFYEWNLSALDWIS